MNRLDVVCEAQKVKPEVTKEIITSCPPNEDKLRLDNMAHRCIR